MLQGRDAAVVMVLVLMASCLSMGLVEDRQGAVAVGTSGAAPAAKRSTRQEQQQRQPHTQTDNGVNAHAPSALRQDRSVKDGDEVRTAAESLDHQVNKRSAWTSAALDLAQEYEEPDVMMKRQSYYRPAGNFASAPYLSAQEYKETFRRSDPYFMGKREDTEAAEEEDSLEGTLEDKRAAPMFVGRRRAPYFVGRRGSPMYAMGDELEDDNDVTEDKRGSPRRRGAPYFIGKRGPPMFVGKRDLSGADTGDELFFLGDRRGAPYFIGKRGPPMFVGKRGTLGGDDGQELFSLGDRRGAPYFIGKRGSPMFVGKRGPPMFVGKRGPPMFVGKRGPPMFVGKRGSPMFVGKRGSPMFVGRRESEQDLEESADSVDEDKRGAPKFVGRRRAPFFVGKREDGSEGGADLLEDWGESLGDEDKRGAPMFVGRRESEGNVTVSELAQLLEALSRLDAIQRARQQAREEIKRGPRMIGKRSSENFQAASAVAGAEEEGAQR